VLISGTFYASALYLGILIALKRYCEEVQPR